MVGAFLATEDRRFGSHPGVDPLAVARAAPPEPAGRARRERRLHRRPAAGAPPRPPAAHPRRKGQGGPLGGPAHRAPPPGAAAAGLPRPHRARQRPARRRVGRAGLLRTPGRRAVARAGRDARRDGRRPRPASTRGSIPRRRRRGCGWCSAAWCAPGSSPRRRRPAAAAAPLDLAAPSRPFGAPHLTTWLARHPGAARARPGGRHRDHARRGAAGRPGGDPAGPGGGRSPARAGRGPGRRQRDRRGPGLRRLGRLPRRGPAGAERRRPRRAPAGQRAQALRLRPGARRRDDARDPALRRRGPAGHPVGELGAAQLRPARPRTGAAPGRARQQLQRPGGAPRRPARARPGPGGAPPGRVRVAPGGDRPLRVGDRPRATATSRSGSWREPTGASRGAAGSSRSSRSAPPGTARGGPSTPRPDVTPGRFLPEPAVALLTDILSDEAGPRAGLRPRQRAAPALPGGGEDRDEPRLRRQLDGRIHRRADRRGLGRELRRAPHARRLGDQRRRSDLRAGDGAGHARDRAPRRSWTGDASRTARVCALSGARAGPALPVHGGRDLPAGNRPRRALPDAPARRARAGSTSARSSTAGRPPRASTEGPGRPRGTGRDARRRGHRPARRRRRVPRRGRAARTFPVHPRPDPASRRGDAGGAAGRGRHRPPARAPVLRAGCRRARGAIGSSSGCRAVGRRSPRPPTGCAGASRDGVRQRSRCCLALGGRRATGLPAGGLGPGPRPDAPGRGADSPGPARSTSRSSPGAGSGSTHGPSTGALRSRRDGGAWPCAARPPGTTPGRSRVSAQDGEVAVVVRIAPRGLRRVGGGRGDRDGNAHRGAEGARGGGAILSRRRRPAGTPGPTSATSPTAR